MEYYRQKGVCTGDACSKLMIQVIIIIIIMIIFNQVEVDFTCLSGHFRDVPISTNVLKIRYITDPYLKSLIFKNICFEVYACLICNICEQVIDVMWKFAVV